MLISFPKLRSQVVKWWLLVTMASLACLPGGLVFAQDQPYLEQGRRAYIGEAFQAFNNTSIQSLHNTESYIYAVDRNNCQSNLSSLRLECMMNYAKENCQSLRGAPAQKACEKYSDIVIVNKLSESNFISKAERYRIAKSATDGDVKQAMMARLQQKYARIVTLFAMSDYSDCKPEDTACLAQGLDQFCLDYTNRESLSWQYCVSAAVWFMGTASNSEKHGK
ncbi:hypothetical protein TDB9533_00549 [Thalassocella blandensis]|nr:hypothetical protein TDB9533_00549 [Thalassocella blandensis]